ncbi:MAG: DUF1684 domain-containing protein [Saprospiraceae bacterium]|nr:DUF1684 domain-containing protein [Saprospiraceae bacterium]
MKNSILLLLVLSTGTFAHAQHWADSVLQHRERQIRDLLADTRQPVDSTTVKGISWFEPDASFRLTGHLEPLTDVTPIDIPTFSGITKPFRPVARFVGRYGEYSFQLTLYEYASKGLSRISTPLFLPFKDPSNGDTSYGGGRYLDIPREILQADTVIIDFNLAYNPLCAYSDGFNCPIPPTENHLDFPVHAGEKAFPDALHKNH